MDNEDQEPEANDDADDYESNDGASEGGTTNEKEKSKPAGCREIIIRWVALGNFCLQGINVVLQQLLPAKSWGALTTTGKIGRGMIYGSSGLGAVHSPVVVYKERQLTNEDTFRSALNGIREEQGRLAEQNDVLSAEIDELQSEVERMKDVEQALRQLADTQGSQLNELMDLINENKEINNGLRAVLKSKVLEEVIGLVLDIDNDGSFTIEDKEIDRLVIGMNLIDDMTFDEKIFRKKVLSCQGNVDEVISMIKDMIRGTDKKDGGGESNTIDLDCDPQEYFNKKRKGG